MSSPSLPILRQLALPDQSSPGFPLQLEDALNGEEYKRCVPNLQGEDLMWLVNYLDKVPDVLDPSGTTFRKCLSELSSICGSKTVLPTSYTLSSQTLSVSPEPVASGGYGDVYQATLERSRVRVKRIRVPHPKFAPEAERVFCTGVVKWKRLGHPNIVQFLGFTIVPLQLVSNWMPNGNLPDYIKKNPDADTIGLVTEVAQGLAYLHSHDVIHRELKGANVLIDASRHARISDFGLAAMTNRENFAMGPNQPEYSPRWSAPEVLSERAHSKAADIFSFGMLMAEIFSGAVPLSELPSFNAALAIIQGRRPSRPMHSAITGRLWNLTQSCWDRDPRLRPQAQEVSRILLTPSSRRRSPSIPTK